MTQIDLSQSTTELRTARSKHREPLNFRSASPSLVLERTKSQRAMAEMIESFLIKAGFDAEKLNKLMAEHRTESRQRIEKQKVDAANYAMSIEGAIRQNLEAQRKTLELLPKPLLSYIQVLDRPALILDHRGPMGADLDILFEQHIEPLNSWIRFLLNTNDASSTNTGSGTEFTFYFLWANPYDFPASVSASTSLRFNGFCDVSAAWGLFSGHENRLSIDASLEVLRWVGWGPDLDGTPDPNYQQTQWQNVLYLDVQGGSFIFGTGQEQSQVFANSSYGLSYNWLSVPARASVIFEVTVVLGYSLSDTSTNISDMVLADFWTKELGYNIKCPQMLIEISPTRPLPTTTS